MVLRTHFVVTKVEPSRIKGFQGLEPLYGMQGVRSSSLLGSILNPLSLTGFFIAWASERCGVPRPAGAVLP